MSEPTVNELPADPAALTRLAARVFDTPLLIHEGKLSQILSVLGPKLGFDLAHPLAPPKLATPAEHTAAMARMVGGIKWEWNDLGYYNVGAAAVVPVIGTLVQRSSWVDSLSGFVSYEKVEARIGNAIEDRDVDEVLIDYDTPGGEAAGAFDAADRMLRFRAEQSGKRITAVVDEFAASAGYLLASTADEIVVPRTGLAGSIGVVGAHVSYAGAMEKRGIAVTFVYAGEKKVDGNPYEALSDRARAEWQEEIDAQYDIFVSTVARNRGLEERAVRGTQAGLYMGDKARTAGLADRISTLATELSVIDAKRRRTGYFMGSPTIEVNTMTQIEKDERDKAVAEARAEGLAQGKKDAVAEAEAAGKAAAAEAVTKACADERARIKAIVTSDEAKGRAELATHLAFETDQTSEAALKLLAVAPSQDAKTPLAVAMAQIGTPGVRSTEADTGDKPKAAVIDTAAIYAERNKQHFAMTVGQSAK